MINNRESSQSLLRRLVIPWPGTALDAAKDIKKNTRNRHQIMIKCFHDYPTVEESSAFIFHSSMKDLRDSTVGNTVLHEVNSR